MLHVARRLVRYAHVVSFQAWSCRLLRGLEKVVWWCSTWLKQPKNFCLRIDPLIRFLRLLKEVYPRINWLTLHLRPPSRQALQAHENPMPSTNSSSVINPCFPENFPRLQCWGPFVVGGCFQCYCGRMCPSGNAWDERYISCLNVRILCLYDLHQEDNVLCNAGRFTLWILNIS